MEASWALRVRRQQLTERRSSPLYTQATPGLARTQASDQGRSSLLHLQLQNLSSSVGGSSCCVPKFSPAYNKALFSRSGSCRSAASSLDPQAYPKKKFVANALGIQGFKLQILVNVAEHPYNIHIHQNKLRMPPKVQGDPVFRQHSWHKASNISDFNSAREV